MHVCMYVCLSVRPSVRPSLCLCVCYSYIWIYYMMFPHATTDRNIISSIVTMKHWRRLGPAWDAAQWDLLIHGSSGESASICTSCPCILLSAGFRMLWLCFKRKRLIFCIQPQRLHLGNIDRHARTCWAKQELISKQSQKGGRRLQNSVWSIE